MYEGGALSTGAKLGILFSVVIVLIVLLIIIAWAMGAFSSSGTGTGTGSTNGSNTGAVGNTGGVSTGAVSQAPVATDWACIGGINVPVRRNADGDLECLSRDGSNCLWQTSESGCNNLLLTPGSPVNPVTCGAKHQAVWGETGYTNPAHWCYKAKKAMGMERFNPWRAWR